MKTNDKGITLTVSQEKVLKQMLGFVFNSTDRVFILKGYAGTGKTTLMRFLIKELSGQDRRFVLLAPTGRAAKVLSNITRRETQTIHGMIYSFANLNKDLSDKEEDELNVDSTGQLYINFEPVKLDEKNVRPTVYIVDESSMVTDVEEKLITQAKFGSGKLLTELLEYDRRPDSKYIFVGDPCQLPPIRERLSPALLPEYFERHFDMHPQEAALTEIMRQKGDNDLIRVSHLIRKLCTTAPDDESAYPFTAWARFPLRGNCNVHLHDNLDRMVESYLDNVQSNGYNDAIFISPSNKKCRELSVEIRRKLGFGCDAVQKGDLLMVIQNNYPTGLMNGDMVEVEEVGDRDMYYAGLVFRQVVVRELFTNETKSALLLMQTVTSDMLNLDAMQQTSLFVDFIKRMRRKGIVQNKDKELFRQAMLSDPFLNALRCVYGYAVTCHKAQGGEWNNVYVDFGMMACKPTKEKYQWVYTAVTRAKETLHVLNKPYIQ